MALGGEDIDIYKILCFCFGKLGLFIKKRFEKFMYNTGKLRNNPVNIKLNAFFSSYLLNKKYKTIGTLNKPT